jgi:hypothetical protein
VRRAQLLDAGITDVTVRNGREARKSPGRYRER